ncbi:MAG: flagellar hook protein FlgE [Deltaproteobacteria bacterium]|nr:MAG: flagellar hook protein FlgE [Deltaproteobacteria bacterium]
MSILNSLFTGTSGLRAHGSAIGVVGDNIANVSTVGFKGARARFADVLGGTAPDANRLGAGVRMGGTDTQFGQGGLLQTGSALDMAIRGRGFFVVSGNHDGQTGTFYTRDGRFSLDDSGYLVTPEGLRVQGYAIDGTGAVSTQLGDLALGAGQSAPQATSSLTMHVNLDANATPPAPFDPLNPDTTSNFSTSATVYDSLGAAHRVDVYFRATGSGAWEWHAMVDGGEITGGTAGTPSEIASGTLTFTPNGELDTEVTTSSSANFINATPGQTITFDFGDSITTDGGTGLAGTTQFAGPSSVTRIDQDGYGAGELVDVTVSEDGTIVGAFSNGQRREIARLALATFTSEQGLVRAGNQLYAETRDSGQALIGAAGSGGRGAISSGSLEGSNVDVGEQLVTLISYQRAFQANARTVTTADEMLAEVANLKR